MSTGWCDADFTRGVPSKLMAMKGERVSIPEAVRRTGVSGDRIFLAIRCDEITTVLDERGIDQVDSDEVAEIASRRT